MVAVFDVGNTNVHIGLYEDHKLLRSLVYRTATKLSQTRAEKIIASDDLKGVVIASVVPHLSKELTIMCRRHKIQPLIVSVKSKCGLKYRYYDPATLGADRVAAVVGALSRYRRNVIVIDAGTAITIDVARRGGDYLGGIICPGMHMLSESIHGMTAQLPKIVVSKPRTLIGRSTEACIRSGVFNGTMAMIRGLIQTIKRRMRGDYYCVATGGAGKVIARYVDEIDEYDEDLCMYGALNIYYRNV
jgi:type III pantothenate kinase